MFTGHERYGRDPRIVTRAALRTFTFPLSPKVKPGDRVFTCGDSDFMIADADLWRDEALGIIDQRPDVEFQILTKRPERITGRIRPRENTMIGISAENQNYFEERWRYPAVTWISAEPLLGYINLSKGLGTILPEWVVIGGESGPNFRQCKLSWITDLVDQCRDMGIRCYVKQDCGPRPGMQGRIPDEYWAVKEFP